MVLKSVVCAAVACGAFLVVNDSAEAARRRHRNHCHTACAPACGAPACGAPACEAPCGACGQTAAPCNTGCNACSAGVSSPAEYSAARPTYDNGTMPQQGYQQNSGYQQNNSAAPPAPLPPANDGAQYRNQQIQNQQMRQDIRQENREINRELNNQQQTIQNLDQKAGDVNAARENAPLKD
ncbi:hypothetical protein [Planctomicrobium piriforme]|nr:hypothetical protein [Planctomicrobium piriforme]